MSQAGRRARAGFTLIELLIVVVIIGILAAIAIPNVMKANRKAKYGRAGADAKTLTTQAMVYALDKGLYPTSIGVLRTGGYTSVADLDPWNTSYQLAPALQAAGAYPVPFTADTGLNGSVGYSSVYGAWAGG